MTGDLTPLFPFPLDDFQQEAISYLQEGKSVVVCAPTGSGKTVIAEFACHLALESNKRCYYTTPLKALSNQKFHDFINKYGEDKVGLLTGDISINRNAPVVVMTTEVFRNMLYGTNFGAVQKNLEDVSCVILDECHYMNDTSRGTVWEESIIYSPPEIQLVALSATIANADKLNAWIAEVHGPTHLVLSQVRPVLLAINYFAQGKLYQLLHSSGNLSGQLKSLFGKKHDRFSKNKYKHKEPLPDPKVVLQVLAKENMLPAIYFLFSRRGCEEAMQKASAICLLTSTEQANLKQAINQLIKGNDNLYTHPHLPCLYKGIAVHHAGMLPSWKVIVEKLFQKGLIKAVFATETLAAGINMPARTTVISAISKRADEGHRLLTASEFLQMSGRAGRRGMDEFGYIVILRHPFEHIEDVAKLAIASPNPLISRFTPSYSMVLNLLQQHSSTQCKELIERSFGQFIVMDELSTLFEQQMFYQSEIAKLSQPLCPKEPGDLNLYRKYMESFNAKSKQLKSIKRGLIQQNNAVDTGSKELLSLKAEQKTILEQAHGMPCHNCPVQKPCANQESKLRSLSTKLKNTNHIISRETGKYWRTFESLASILRLQGYLNGDTVTHLGKMASAIRATNELFIAEVIISNALKSLTVPEFAAVLCALVSEDIRTDKVSLAKYSPNVEFTLKRIEKIARKIYLLQRDFAIDISIEFSSLFCGLAQLWAEGASWQEMRKATLHDEGIVVRALRRTVDLSRQIALAPNVPDDIAHLARKTQEVMYRDEVKEDY